MLAQVQAEAAASWQSPADGRATVRGAERQRAWSEGLSLHAGVVIAEHDRNALERLCRYGARPAFAQDRLAWTDDGAGIRLPLTTPALDGLPAAIAAATHYRFGSTSALAPVAR